MAKLFILFDGRAKDGDTDDAAVLVTARSEKEARRDSDHFKDYDAVWFEYDVKGKNLINEIMRSDIHPAPTEDGEG